MASKLASKQSTLLILKHVYRNFCIHQSTSAVGFIGLGNMGGPMAMNLLKHKKDVFAFDLVESAKAEASQAGAKMCSSPSEVAANCSTIITMLPNSANVKDVYLESDGILQSVKSGSILLDCSTIDPAVAKLVANEALQRSATYLDAPVSGGVTAAAAGTLTFMVGGPEEAFETAKETLQMVGKNIVRCGGVGSGQAVKLCNNMLLASSMIATAECINMGVNLGLDAKLLTSILSTATGRCWSVDTYNPCPGVIEGVPSSNDYKGGFACALMAKDLTLAMQAASDSNSQTQVGTLAHKIYKQLCAEGYDGKDFSSIFQYIQNK